MALETVIPDKVSVHACVTRGPGGTECAVLVRAGGLPAAPGLPRLPALHRAIVATLPEVQPVSRAGVRKEALAWGSPGGVLGAS